MAVVVCNLAVLMTSRVDTCFVAPSDEFPTVGFFEVTTDVDIVVVTASLVCIVGKVEGELVVRLDEIFVDLNDVKLLGDVVNAVELSFASEVDILCEVRLSIVIAVLGVLWFDVLEVDSDACIV